ncbi:tRNA (cytosine(38)-C(5))-methyltransferase-like [Penaeus japonicus]|uniref:tRNA (cytosine(38)-C(5))-methyltransferase-like n=1 Tax=Penaeus japonicus TaxID=27405 RepID=UPI001C70CF15|nr:tRNA (cytosine(38)-C(5))-methyltransferase-like [Penaeus japonicus]
MTMGPPLRLLELYSGIGGMHAAMKESGLNFEVVGSFEINTSALEVYRQNFPGTSKPRNIMGLTLNEMEQLSPNIIMMSPPCQPFTRQGLKRDVEDTRTSSFLHFLGLLEEVTTPPEMILLENVAGFEVSQARERLIDVLGKRGYTWQEFLLSPTEVGVPNSRLRYYLLAKLKPSTFCFPRSPEISNELPLCLCCRSQEKVSSSEGICQDCNKPILPSLQCLLHRFHSSQNADSLEASSSFRNIESSLSHYLEKGCNVELYLLGTKILQKYFMILDIVTSQSKRSCCFTKGYAHYVEGTGSIVQHNTDISMPEIYSEVQSLPPDDPERVRLLQGLQLRYFTPQEVTRLMCFPSWFEFPPTVTKKQKYKVLGNSVNVLVITSLLLTLVESGQVVQ